MTISLIPLFARRRGAYFPFYLRPVASWKVVVFGLLAFALLAKAYPF